MAFYRPHSVIRLRVFSNGHPPSDTVPPATIWTDEHNVVMGILTCEEDVKTTFICALLANREFLADFPCYDAFHKSRPPIFAEE